MRGITAFAAALPHLAGALLLVLHGNERHQPKVEPRAVVPPPAIIRESPPRAPHPARTLTMRLESGEPAPDGRPNTWVHIPQGFDPSSPLALTFLFHGFKNCIESYTSRGAQCVATNIKRPGYDIAAQLERAGSRSIVVVPETSFDVMSAEAPTLAKRGAFRAYVDELLAALADETGHKSTGDVRRFALAASSGGYQALEPILGELESLVTDVLLLDAGYLYPNSAVGRFFSLCAADLAAGAGVHRGGILYTPSGGALPASEELLHRTTRRLQALGAEAKGRFAHTRGDPAAGDLAAPLYILRVDEEHDVVVRRNLGRVIASAGL